MASEYISTTETAKMIRAALKKAFPAVKFSVRSDKYAGGSSIDVSWSDGPTTAMVEPIAKQFQGADFDGMIDLKTYNQHFLLPDGSACLADREGTTGTIAREHHFKPSPEARRVQFAADFVFCHRTLSPAFLNAFQAAWKAMSEDERSRLMDKTGAWRAGFNVQSWRCDENLTDFGPQATDVFRCMARQVAA